MIGAVAGRTVHRTHFGHDAIHLGRGDDGLVRSQIGAALVRNRLLEIRHDLGAIRIVRELPLGLGQVLAQGVVPALIELVRVAIQVDADDFLHGYFPSWVMVTLRCFQYSISSASCDCPLAVSW